jgi:glycosyltransferase involved in cell wall biosynthesis
MQFVWIALGRLEPVKDHRTLLRAFARLVREPFLRIVGTGTELDALKNLARELAIERRVEFTGFQDNVQELLASADAFVLSSLWEGLPVSILEAQAAGLPVVATDGSGTREAMADRRSGFLVPTGNVPALAEKMARVMNMSPEERRVMGENGQAFVRERSDLAAIVDQWERLYERLRELHKKRSRWSS